MTYLHMNICLFCKTTYVYNIVYAVLFQEDLI